MEGPGTLWGILDDAAPPETPGDPPLDDVSACAVWGDPDDREELVLTFAQELLYSSWWCIREEERLRMEEVD